MNQFTQSQKSLRLAGLLIIAALVLAACAPAAAPTAAPTTAPIPQTAPTAAATAAPTAAPVTEATINVATDPKFGKILVADNGMTLYMYTKDEPDKSNCAGGCLKAWPPLTSLGSPKAGEGVDAALISTTSMADGSKIATYNHMPLYYWKSDTKPGDITGLGVGGVWFLVSPEGKVIGQEASISVGDNSKYGKILVDAKGMTLYMYTKDEPDKSNCSADCLKAWPPLLTEGKPTLGDGVDTAMIGTATLADGSKIATYNHMPLYYWAKDEKAGDTTGVGVGGVWYLVSPDGKVVGKEDNGSGTPSPAAASGPMLNVATTDEYGKILVDGKGMTLYIFTKDEPNKSNCSENCLKAWPPFLTDGNTMAGEGVDKSMIGTATLADGTKIVTYNQMPLYYWASDTKPGDTTGQNVNSVWFVIGPDGTPNKKD